MAGPHLHELGAAGLLGERADVAHEVALQRVWQHGRARRAERFEQFVADRAGKSAGEASCERGRRVAVE